MGVARGCLTQCPRQLPVVQNQEPPASVLTPSKEISVPETEFLPVGHSPDPSLELRSNELHGLFVIDGAKRIRTKPQLGKVTDGYTQPRAPPEPKLVVSSTESGLNLKTLVIAKRKIPCSRERPGIDAIQDSRTHQSR